MTKTSAINILCKHALATLPATIDERENVLGATTRLLPRNSQVTTHVREMLFHLEQHRALQADLPGLFESKTKRGAK